MVCADGVGIMGNVPSGACTEDALLDIDCQVMKANIKTAMPTNALRVVSKMFAPGFEYALA